MSCNPSAASPAAESSKARKSHFPDRPGALVKARIERLSAGMALITSPPGYGYQGNKQTKSTARAKKTARNIRGDRAMLITSQ
jgi:hypothetical protein